MVDYCDYCGYLQEVEIVEHEHGNSISQVTVCEDCKDSVLS